MKVRFIQIEKVSSYDESSEANSPTKSSGENWTKVGCKGCRRENTVHNRCCFSVAITAQKRGNVCLAYTIVHADDND